MLPRGAPAKFLVLYCWTQANKTPSSPQPVLWNLLAQNVVTNTEPDSLRRLPLLNSTTLALFYHMSSSTSSSCDDMSHCNYTCRYGYKHWLATHTEPRIDPRLSPAFVNMDHKWKFRNITPILFCVVKKVRHLLIKHLWSVSCNMFYKFTMNYKQRISVSICVCVNPPKEISRPLHHVHLNVMYAKSWQIIFYYLYFVLCRVTSS